MFLIGVITYQHRNFVGKYFKLTLIGFPMMLVCIILDSSVLILFQSSGNRLGVVYFISYCAVIMFLGFGTKVMKIKFDFSYGIYIWHMVVINFFFIIGWNSMSLFILTTISLACFSWFVIEKPALKLKIDFGDELGIKKSSAQINYHYTPNDLLGKSVLAVVNFSPRQIGKFMSEVLVLGLSDDNGNIVLITPDSAVPVGAKLH